MLLDYLWAKNNHHNFAYHCIVTCACSKSVQQKLDLTISTLLTPALCVVRFNRKLLYVIRPQSELEQVTATRTIQDIKICTNYVSNVFQKVVIWIGPALFTISYHFNRTSPYSASGNPSVRAAFNIVLTCGTGI